LSSKFSIHTLLQVFQVPESYGPAHCESTLSSHRHSSRAHRDLDLAVAGCTLLLATKL